MHFLPPLLLLKRHNCPASALSQNANLSTTQMKVQHNSETGELQMCPLASDSQWSLLYPDLTPKALSSRIQSCCGQLPGRKYSPGVSGIH